MFRLKVDKKLQKALERMDEDIFLNHTKKTLMGYALILQRKVVDEMWKRDLKDTGKLIQSVKIEPPKVSRNRVSVTVYVDKPYASPLEFGTQPSWPPETYTFRKWVERKLGVPKDRSRQVLYLIRRKIAKRGIKARKYMFSAVKWMENNMSRVVERVFNFVVS